MPTQFRWPETWHDLALAREVAAHRPKKRADWDEIAERLSLAFHLKVELKGRGCRERLERLVGKLRSEDSKALKRSGTEEDYSELTQLLEDIYSYQRDIDKKLEEEKAAKLQKEVQEKTMAEEMRRSAMETITQRKRRMAQVNAEEELDSEDELCPIKPKSRRASKMSAVEMLENKFKMKAELKEKELELRKKELELKEKQMEREYEEKQKMDEERKRRMEMEFEERKTMLGLLQKLVPALQESSTARES